MGIGKTVMALLCASIMIMGTNAEAQEAEKVNYMPNIHGVLRPRVEWATGSGEYRFSVRNARVSVDGQVARSISYYVNADFCDRGKIKILDVWARLGIVDGLSVQAGQFRMPFGVDVARGPFTYYFSNRSFMGKQMCNFRAVGMKLSYKLPAAPLTVEAGIFNPTTIGDHSGWNKKLAYSAKAFYRIGHVTLTTGFMSVLPDGVRANMVDGCVSWSAGRWIVEGEYLYKRYTDNDYKPCHGYNLFADYHMPIKAGVFNRLSFQGRWDGMTGHATHHEPDGSLSTGDAARNRITLGTTISYIRSKNMFVDLRLDYEKYLYRHDTPHDAEQGDKAVLEIVLRF